MCLMPAPARCQTPRLWPSACATSTEATLPSESASAGSASCPDAGIGASRTAVTAHVTTTWPSRVLRSAIETASIVPASAAVQSLLWAAPFELGRSFCERRPHERSFLFRPLDLRLQLLEQRQPGFGQHLHTHEVAVARAASRSCRTRD